MFDTIVLVRIVKGFLYIFVICLCSFSCQVDSGDIIIPPKESEYSPVAITTKTPTTTPSVKRTPWSTLAISRFNPQFVIDDECSVPCWKGIIPGVTTLEEVRVILPAIKQINYGLTDELLGFSEYLFKDQNRVEVVVIFEDEVVKTLYFSHMSFTIGEIIDLIGDPDGIVVEESDDGHSAYLDIVEIFYPRIGVRIKARDLNTIGYNSSVKVHSDMRVRHISFHEPINSGIFQDIYENWVLYDYESSINRGLVMIPWEGYGIYDNSRP
jgi:hypothetical protein